MAEIKVFGYADKISVKPGDEISFHVHADGTDTAQAQLVRLIHGDEHRQGLDILKTRSSVRLTAHGTSRSSTRRSGIF
jgi:N,N-dimethylformamidase